MDKFKDSIIRAALDAAANLKATADRLEHAAEARDFYTLAEIAFSTTSWTLDAIRGAALAVTRIEG
jgi:hypothetical protein